MTRHAADADPTAYESVTNPSGPSRPSKNNCTSHQNEPKTADSDDSRLSRRRWWKERNRVTDLLKEEMPQRSNRPAAVREETMLREEAVHEKNTDGHRAASMLTVVDSFLSWYNDYRHAHLLFESPDGELSRTQLENSHQPGYGNRYYARFKALERQAIEQFDDPHAVLLTFSGSHRNADGGWRCPVDHLRDVVDSWRPDRGRGVYDKLMSILEGERWEYCVAVEHNSKGYGHVHVGVFVDGEVTQEQFRPVIDRHLKLCDIAHPDAHDYHHSDPEKRPISVNRINPDVDPDDYDGSDDVMGEVGNLGSYMAEYIGATADSELFDRSPEELFFRAACWASGTQRVRFSTGANELIDADRTDRQKAETRAVRWQPGTTAEDIERVCADPEAGVADLLEGDFGWCFRGVARADEEGEEVYNCEHSAVQYREIDGAEHLDRPAKQPSVPPKPEYEQGALDTYS